jgi:hypothetical protein
LHTAYVFCPLCDQYGFLRRNENKLRKYKDDLIRTWHKRASYSKRHCHHAGHAKCQNNYDCNKTVYPISLATDKHISINYNICQLPLIHRYTHTVPYLPGMVMIRDAQIFQNSRNYPKILGTIKGNNKHVPYRRSEDFEATFFFFFFKKRK